MTNDAFLASVINEMTAHGNKHDSVLNVIELLKFGLLLHCCKKKCREKVYKKTHTRKLSVSRLDSRLLVSFPLIFPFVNMRTRVVPLTVKEKNAFCTIKLFPHFT